MHLTALVESLDHVCCRYRLAAFRPWLQQAGHTLELLPFPPSWWGWWSLTRRLRHADTVILQRRLLPGWQLTLVRRSARQLILDFDDAIFLRDSYHPRGLHSNRRQHRFEALVRAADRVTAGNAYLAEAARNVAANRPIQVMPTYVDPNGYFPAKHMRAGPGVQLVWIGSASTLQGLSSIKPLLEHVGQACAGLCLKLVSDRFLSLATMSVLNRPWDEVHEATELATADLGISWLPDDLWSRGKCGLKILQYMAAGLPVVANPVGVQKELVRHGETGFLAETPEQWAEAVSRLALDPALRQRMGRAGRQRVEKEFSVSAGARQWLAFLTGQGERRLAA